MAWVERSIWILIVLLLTALLLWIRADMDELTEWVSMQNEQLAEIDALLDIAETRSDAIRAVQHNPMLVPDYEIRLLKANGLEDPLNDLKRDLMANSQIIPYEPVLGGTMQFYTADDILILPGAWVYAIFEDGHINGAMMLGYRVHQGEITWTVIAHQLF